MKNATARTVLLKKLKKLTVSHERGYVISEILGMTLSQTANGKNDTFAVCHRLFFTRLKVFVFVDKKTENFNIRKLKPNQFQSFPGIFSTKNNHPYLKTVI